MACRQTVRPNRIGKGIVSPMGENVSFRHCAMFQPKVKLLRNGKDNQFLLHDVYIPILVGRTKQTCIKEANK